MGIRMLSIGFILLSLMLLPAAITGCGTDDGDANTRTGIYTIGPGNLESFNQATHTVSLR